MFGWGVSDFFANNASDKIGHTKTLFWSQLAGLLLMGLTVLFFTKNFHIPVLVWVLILLGGIVYTVGYLLFYKAFEIGNVSVVSAVVGSQNLFVILVSYFIFNQTLTKLQIPALVLIMVGITLVSINFKELFSKSHEISIFSGVRETLLAAFLFGAFFWPMSEYSTEHADWILVSFITKVVAIVAIILISYFNKEGLRVEAPTKRLTVLVVAVGILEAIAILGASFGISLGDAIIVAPISSALTVVTVFLAMIFLNEKISKLQALGIAITICGIVLTGF